MTAITTRIGGIEWTHPRTVGVVGIILGALAFWLALPPLVTRTAALPIVVGILAISAGIWAWSRQERRVGGGAVAAGLLGIALGLLATNSSETHLNQVVVWSALGAATLRYATPLTFAAIGGLYCERSGVINVALEGMLLTGAFFVLLHGGLPWVAGTLAMTAALIAPFGRGFYRHANLLSGKLRAGTVLPLVTLLVCVSALAAFEPKLRWLDSNAFWSVILSPDVPNSLRAA